MDTPPSRTLFGIENTDQVHRSGFRERLVMRWAEKLAAGRLTIEFPSGARKDFEGATPGPHAMLTIKDLDVVIRLLFAGDIGFAEGYMAGEWETPDLSTLLTFGALNRPAVSGALGRPGIVSFLNRIRHGLRANTPKGSRRNIAAHYDLGNDFYGLWLDETMTYSSALFTCMDTPMATAQRDKYLRIAAALDLRPGDRVLEIGCGWGGFAEIAAQEFGCQVLCLTLSAEQASYARERMDRAGLMDRVEIRVQDYREITGEYDKIVSIEMFEAVGEPYWRIYLEQLKALLKPGGKAALQIITIDDDHFRAYRRDPDFVQRYIFPGGMLPSPEAFTAVVAERGLTITDRFFFGSSYAETMRRWHHGFQENWHEISKLGFDNRFYRMWRYYMAYCEAGFETGIIDVGQFVIERK
ncbi:MAG TPA: SAM-dependent methyltransferase [Rhodospirillaceae bacterium]|nr:SAM-dependent methyltransferase [Rhodospirillaceae bacterium]